MYQNCYFDNKKQTVHIWDDEKGYFTLPYKRYAYVKDRNGHHISLYGDRLRKVYRFEPDTPNLFESEKLISRICSQMGHFNTFLCTFRE